MCLGVPGKIISIDESSELMRSGPVSFDGVRKDINLALVPEAGVGDFVLVHAGFAIAVIDEAEAERVFALLEQLP